LLKVGLIALMALGSLALWIALPAAWLWLTRDLQSVATRFLIVIAGCAITMVSAGALLFRLEAVYARITGTAGPVAEPPRYLRTAAEERRPRRRLTLLEIFLVVSAVVALVTLVVWWALLADAPNPSGPLQPL
jgi:ABC-type uncharacterized transport system permease subunit